jgi:hypothetical protein
LCVNKKDVILYRGVQRLQALNEADHPLDALALRTCKRICFIDFLYQSADQSAWGGSIRPGSFCIPWLILQVPGYRVSIHIRLPRVRI